MPGDRCADTFLPKDAAFLNTEQLSLSWYLSKVIAFANGHLSKLFEPAPGTPMTSTPPPVDAEEYLENLMRAGQDAMKQFDDTLASVAGVGTKDSLSSGRLFFPFALIADLQREYFKQLWQFWNSMFLQTFAGGAHSSVGLARGDRRFKDDAWHEMPYYDLLKQTYLLAHGSCMNSLIGRRSMTRQNYSFGFMPGSLLTR